MMGINRRGFLKASATFAALAAVGCANNRMPQYAAPETRNPPPPAGDTLRLVVLGDWGSGQMEQWQVSRGMEAVAAQLGGFHAGLMLGDNFYPRGVSSVEDPLWKQYFEEVYDTTHLGLLPWYAILGNHDYAGNVRAQLKYNEVNPRWNMPGNYYSQTWHDAAGKPLLTALAVDTNKEYDNWTRQMNFLRDGLRAADHPVVVLGHHPIYTGGSLGAERRVKTEMRDVLIAGGARAYIASHEHNMQCIAHEGLVQLIQGGGGKTLTPLLERDTPPGHEWAAVDYGFSVLTVKGDSVKFDFRDREGNVLHERAL